MKGQQNLKILLGQSRISFYAPLSQDLCIADELLKQAHSFYAFGF